MRDLARLLLAAAIVWGTVRFTADGTAPRGDSDERAHALAQSLRPGYVPWAAPIFQPDDSTESRLFHLQSAAGAALFAGIVVIARRRRQRHAPPRTR